MASIGLCIISVAFCIAAQTAWSADHRVDLCAGTEMRIIIEDSILVLTFDTSAFTDQLLPLQCNMSIEKIPGHEFILPAYKVELNETNGLRSYWDSAQQIMWQAGHLVYWRCFGQSCQYVQINSKTDFQYFHQNQAMLFYLTLNDAPSSDIGRKDIIGAFDLHFPGYNELIIKSTRTTRPENSADEPNGSSENTDPSVVNNQVEGPVRQKQETQGFDHNILLTCLAVLFVVALIILAIVFIRCRRRRKHAQTPPPTPAPVIYENQASGFTSSVYIHTEEEKKQVPDKDDEYDGDITKEPLPPSYEDSQRHLAGAVSTTEDTVAEQVYTIKRAMVENTENAQMEKSDRFEAGFPPAYDNDAYDKF